MKFVFIFIKSNIFKYKLNLLIYPRAYLQCYNQITN